MKAQVLKIMMTYITALTLLSGLAFIVYGILCIATEHMSQEFTRYGLSQFQIIIGVLELVGGLGTLFGLSIPSILIASTLGLAILMLLGVIIRIRVQDSLIQILPAFILMVLNFFLFYNAIKELV